MPYLPLEVFLAAVKGVVSDEYIGLVQKSVRVATRDYYAGAVASYFYEQTQDIRMRDHAR